MEDRAKDLMAKGAPWRRDVPWPVVAIQAVVLIGIGGFILLDKDSASDVILQLIGLLLLMASGFLAVNSFRNPETGLGSFDAFRAGIGATAGAIATVSWWSDYIENQAVRNILGWGLLAYSLLHLAGIIMVRGRAGLRPSLLVILGLALALGIVLLTGDDASTEGRLTLLGILLLVFGALLGALAWYLQSRGANATAADTSTAGTS
jgi:uncharacterized membrane protein HdeD (DUF308 family)